MSTILETDATGTLHLPPSLLPHPGPGRRYSVAVEADQVVVRETPAPAASKPNREAWLKKLALRHARVATGETGAPLQEILDEIRGDR